MVYKFYINKAIKKQYALYENTSPFFIKRGKSRKGIKVEQPDVTMKRELQDCNCHKQSIPFSLFA